MIHQEIVEKFKLAESGLRIGQSEKNNCRVLKSELLSTDSRLLYVQDCDQDGDPIYKDMISIVELRPGIYSYLELTPDFLLDINIDILDNLLKERSQPILYSRSLF